jgi:hypothetical protein
MTLRDFQWNNPEISFRRNFLFRRGRMRSDLLLSQWAVRGKGMIKSTAD